MLDARLRDIMLVDELQLGERLNESLSAGDRADFALLLAMLSQNVEDSPQFADPVKEHETSADLRQLFGLKAKTALYAGEADFARASELAARLKDGGMQSVFLEECLRDEPVSELERPLPPEVFSSLSPLSQEKFMLERQGEKPARLRIAERGDGFGVLEEISGSHAAFDLSQPSIEAQA